MRFVDTNKSPNRIQEVREEAGMTRRDLASRVGVSARQIIRYETGEQSPTLRVAERIADVLDCSLDELAAATA